MIRALQDKQIIVVQTEMFILGFCDKIEEKVFLNSCYMHAY